MTILKEIKTFEFKGIVKKCICDYSNFKAYAVEIDETKYPDIKLNKYQNVSVIGDFQPLIIDVEYRFKTIEEETKYGISYKAFIAERKIPTTIQEKEKFLKEIITKKQADTILAIYPDIVDKVMNNDLDDIDLDRLQGIGGKTFNKIKEKIIENFSLSTLIAEYSGCLSINVLSKLLDKYKTGDNIKYRLQNEPYKTLCSLDRIGFKKADSILLAIDKLNEQNEQNGEESVIKFEEKLVSSKQRCVEAILFLLKENENKGNTKANLIELRSECFKLVPETSERFNEAIIDDRIYYNSETLEIASKYTYQMEFHIAQKIKNNVYNQDNVWNIDTKKYRNTGDITLTDEQIETLNKLCKYNIVILEGKAGTGKTNTIKSILNMLSDNNKAYELLAPTGRAAKVMSKYTSRDASTIHREIAHNLFNNKDTPQDEWDKIIFSNGVVIVDEFSMVDVYLFYKLLESIDFSTTKLLLIGDSSQIPSVGCGNLLNDFIESKVIPTTTLTRIFRYGEGGLMKVATDTRNSKPYLNNSMKNKMTSFGKGDYIFIDTNSENITKNIVALYKKLLDKGFSIGDIQVLSAKNVGNSGSIELNNEIQKIANPNYAKSKFMKVGDITYYIGDLVIQKQNNYKAKIDDDDIGDDVEDEVEDSVTFIANGESGIIEDIIDGEVIINFDGFRIKYTQSDMQLVKLGYAISIHSSQGGSARIIILCTPKSHTFMLNSNLLYTGLTRMRERCFHFGSINTINIAVKKKANLLRNTFMLKMLTE